MSRHLRLTCALALLLASGLAAHAEDPGRDMTGSWNRYPQLGEAPDPKLPAPPPSTYTMVPPLKPDYLAKWQEEQKAAHDADARGQPIAGGYVHCLPDGMPSMMHGMFPMEMLLTPGQVTITQEAYNQTRRIYLGEKQIDIADAEPTFYGHAVGHWEGNTLVVDTVGIKPSVMVRGTPHSPDMRIDERLKLLTKDFLEDQITITDPQYLTQPWTYKVAFTRMPGYKMLEYVCENNREYADPATGGTRLKVSPPAQ